MCISDWSSDVCSSDLVLSSWVWVPIYGILKDRTCSKYIALHNNVDDATKPRRPGSPKTVLESTVMKKLVEILRANGGHWVGDGFPVRTLFSYHGDTKAISPFLLRSEEHTSELQSLMRISYAVFCLKKKNTKQ